MENYKKNNKFSFIAPVSMPQTPDILVSDSRDLSTLKHFNQHELLAVDIETKGTQVANKDCHIVGLSISNTTAAAYFDKRSIGPTRWRQLIRWLKGCRRLMAHNAVFDAGFLYVEANYHWLSWKVDTYALARQLCGEGFPGQRWSLKWLQTEAMLWPETNEKELDEWLVENGHIEGKIAEEKNTPEGRLHSYRHERKKNGSLFIRPDKSKMHLAPPKVLGTYCCLDSFSTRMLFEVFNSAIEKKLGAIGVEEFWSYHETFLKSVRLHVSQQLCGIHTDPAKFDNTLADLDAKMHDISQKILWHPSIDTHMVEWHQQAIDRHFAKEPKKMKDLPKLGQEPAKMTRSGQPSKNWEKWNERREWVASLGEGEVSKNWLKWNDKFLELQGMAERRELFNFGSDLQLIWLFHEKLGYPVVKRTDSGAPATDEDAKLQWGEVGRLLIELDILEKRKTYVVSAKSAALECGDNIIHPQFKMPGTLTCRLAGGGSKKGRRDVNFSLQQQPKDRDYLENFKPPPGYVLAGRDWASVEDVVIYEITRDVGFAKIYGPNAPKGNCGYIFTGAGLPGLGKKFLDAGYDPDNPDPEVVKRIKKDLKADRQIAKAVKLGKSYGMGGKKFHQNMKMQGIHIPLEQCYELIAGLDEVFPQAYKELPEELTEEWLANGGWILSALGQPISVSHSKLKDLTNRLVQRSSHDAHQLSISLVEEEAIKRGWTMMWKPGIVEDMNVKFAQPWIVDYHDESIWAVREELAEEWCEIVRAADIKLNEWLGGHIPLRGEPEIGQSLADFKCE